MLPFLSQPIIRIELSVVQNIGLLVSRLGQAGQNAGRWPPCTSAHVQRLAPATIFQPPVLILGHAEAAYYEVRYRRNVYWLTEDG